ncbi:unannotated protein [freshwater metagenome]|uniref:Unannotated protein n=1 Tax=freshwater metagenome TaxID=449393 RepID=A0A6J7PGH7_9ZZZZ|nr:hypothetical protein [Actinomycetota bacterium]MSW11222.1 hypothetical protein [Actinomycetota bacterium]
MEVRSAVAAAAIAGMALALSACGANSTSTPTESAAADLGVSAAAAYGKGDKPANAASRIVAIPERANATGCAGLRTTCDHVFRGA